MLRIKILPLYFMDLNQTSLDGKYKSLLLDVAVPPDAILDGVFFFLCRVFMSYPMH